ncbi:16S rRNA (uracil(1498)-N(3))-methyltransferase [Paenalcaligenes niemegkensis]|uniref:16S rRNA (uracil(1498)-N(3))-methyltransferase n=1 Tax=Paenalcaligenes niemegkensis TaxID=2895469 RepID=UPI001EE958A6|nr:16S rRNA (uracil(1498)-N(3))-methyltransferase [Paenalcaligenes niemegkensis]MCQ9617149.1 16S rRNA (uracil(1498)-N(3))-methyltransferase [Paenalcaligenes niemegkensis]
MNLPRFYCNADLQTGATIELADELAHYMTRVLRLKDGSAVWLFNGVGGQFLASLQQQSKKVSAVIGTFHDVECELAGKVTVAQGLASGDKMDWIIEKCTEIGVTTVAPIAARYSVLQLSGERLQKRLAHWQKVARSASEQCGRNRINQVMAPQSLAAYLSTVDASAPQETRIVFCDPDADHDLDSALAGLTPAHDIHLILLIGPEGGWSEEEKAQAIQAGAYSMRFGSRILRTETAAIALVSAASARLGWL